MSYFRYLPLITIFGAMASFSATASAEQSVPMEKLQAEWHQKAISVDNGKAKPGIEKLATAFCEAWRTDVCDDVLLYIRNPKRFKSLYNQNDDTAYDVTIDRTNGFVMANDEGGDRAYLSAAIWRRANGHTLLGIHTGKPVDPEIDIVLFYDYDPGTEKLTPEKRISDYLISKRYGQVAMTWVELPRKGKDVHVSAYDGEPAIEYTFKFNGTDFDEPIIEMQ